MRPEAIRPGFADALGIVGGYIVSVGQLQVDPTFYFTSLFQWLWLRDIFAGLGGYFANDPAMDWDGSGLPVTLNDFFAFFADWFVPC